MAWIISLLAISVIYSISTYITYSEDWRKSIWYYPFSITIAVIAAIIWCSMIRLIDEKKGIYIYSLVWDTIVCCVFYFIPLLFFGVKLDKISALGLAMMIGGLVLIKMNSD